ncbi:hypothetical protein D3C84_406110 [compost metagenome]
MPDKAAAFPLAPVLGLIRAVDRPQNALRGGNLIRAHHQQRVADIKYRVVQQHIKQGVLLEKGGGKVFQILDQAVIRLRPVHGEVEAVLVALGSVGKVTAVGAVGDHEQLQIFEQGIRAIEAFLAVAVHLIEGLANRYTTLLQLHLHQWQTIDQNRHVVAIGVAALLLKLFDHLHLVADDVLLVQQVDVLNTPVVKDEVVNVIVVDLAGFLDDAVAGLVQPSLDKAQPLAIGKLHVIERLQLHAHIG